MEIKAYKKLPAEFKNELLEFLGDECGDKFFPYEEREDEGGNNFFVAAETGKIIGYGEMFFLPGEDTCLGERKAVSSEIEKSVICEMLKEAGGRGLEINFCSYDMNDVILTECGLRLSKADYMMVYEGSSDKAFARLPEGYELVTDSLNGMGLYEFSICETLGKFVCGCVVAEYESSVCIAEVFTEEAYRRKGFAGMLIGSIIKNFNGKKVMLHVEGANEGAAALYGKLGFSVIESVYTFAY